MRSPSNVFYTGKSSEKLKRHGKKATHGKEARLTFRTISQCKIHGGGRMWRLRVVFSATTFSSYNPGIAKNRVMPQIGLADEFDERRTRLEASTRPVYISSKNRR